MKFMAMRELRSESSKFLQALSPEEEVVLTNTGKPVAIISHVTEDNLEDLGLWLPIQALDLDLVDKDDLVFLEVAVGGRAHFMVTGNKRHFPESPFAGIHILEPRRFIGGCPEGNQLIDHRTGRTGKTRKCTEERMAG